MSPTDDLRIEIHLSGEAHSRRAERIIFFHPKGRIDRDGHTIAAEAIAEALARVIDIENDPDLEGEYQARRDMIDDVFRNLGRPR